MKTQILAAIGETVLQPAARLNEALAANDRIKYYFSLLQLALSYAEHPNQPSGTLKRERIACGIDDPDLDTVVAEARASGKSCHVPGAARILAKIAADARLMAAPVLASHEDGLEARLDGLLKALPTGSGDLLDPESISAMMQAGHDHPDSLHRLVMDLHKRLNTMQAELAEETLDGAAVYGLSDPDRPLVAAFMAGVNRTAKLKFNHPGLATTATRAGDRLGYPKRYRNYGRARDRDSRGATRCKRHLHRCARRAIGSFQAHAAAPGRVMGQGKHRLAGRGIGLLHGDRPPGCQR